MCGIAGAFSATSRALPAAVFRMSEQIRHRGPDDDGLWSDGEAGIALGHRRLAVQDPTAAGKQPMVSPCGRWVIVFNGEIYNHHAIRRDIERATGGCWSGHSDTETLVSAIALWGFDQTLSRLVGMFAVAAWDRSSRSLWLARDRMGEKPLYYGWIDGDFVFASELRAILAYSGGAGLSVSRSSLLLLTSLNYIPAPWSIYREIGKLMPGTYLHLKAPTDQSAQATPYWTFPLATHSGCHLDPSSNGGLDACLGQVDAALRRSVKSQMLSDVPLGALLSGGIDSSLVVALMQSESSERIKTFTIGFDESSADESRHARQIAQHLGTDHHEMILTPTDALGVIPRLPGLLDEPMADSSQIPTMCVMELARRHVTVALSGDGADELFGGYGRYRRIPKAWGRMRMTPRWIRASLNALVQPDTLDHIAALGGNRGRDLLRKSRYYLPRMAGAYSARDLYVGMLMQWIDAPVVKGLGQDPRDSVYQVLSRAESTDLVPFMMEADALTYLPDDVMVKVDRSAMACSLETRAPFLSQEVVELSSRLPLSCKLDQNRGKAILHECLAKHLPREMFERPKQGFSVPLDAWLRGPLREWAEELLDPKRIQREGYFDPVVVERAWRAHQEGRRNHGHQLWSVLMFQGWLAQHPAMDASP